MRPEKAYNIISKHLKPFYSSNVVYPQDLKITRNFKLAIKSLLRHQLREEREYNFESSQYYKVSYDTEEMTSILHYISDRFNCVGRLKFLNSLVNR